MQSLTFSITFTLIVDPFILQVFLYNRLDCCSERLSGVKVEVGATNHAKGALMCGAYGNATGKRVLEITCNSQLKGRFVTVSLKDAPLTLCKVKVMAVPVTKKGLSAFVILF